MNLPLFIVLVSLAIIVIMVLRKFPTLASIDTASIPEEQHNKKKKDLYSLRLKRKIGEQSQKVKPVFLPLFQMLKKSFVFIFKKTRELGNVYRLKRKQGRFPDSPNPAERDVFVEADEYLHEGQLIKAEESFITLIEHNPKHIDAYEGLAEVYLQKKDYEHAEEILAYVVKLKGHITEEGAEEDTDEQGEVIAPLTDRTDHAQHYFELGEVHEKNNEFLRALRSYKEALKINEHHPKYLDALLRVSIQQGNRLLAEKTLATLKKVNPQNVKISEWEEQVSELS